MNIRPLRLWVCVFKGHNLSALLSYLYIHKTHILVHRSDSCFAHLRYNLIILFNHFSHKQCNLHIQQLYQQIKASECCQVITLGNYISTDPSNLSALYSTSSEPYLQLSKQNTCGMLANRPSFASEGDEMRKV